jgi:hypothetical protein
MAGWYGRGHLDWLRRKMLITKMERWNNGKCCWNKDERVIGVGIKAYYGNLGIVKGCNS